MKINILFLNSARSWGGNEKWTRMAADALSEDHEVVLACRSSVIGNQFKNRTYYLPFIFELDLLTIIPLIGITLFHRIDVLIPTKRKDYVLSGIVSRVCGRVNILRLGIVRRLKSSRIQAWIYRDLTDGLIVNAKRIQTELLKTYYMQYQNIRVIYNGIDTQHILRLTHPIAKPCAFLMTTMGTLIPRKGVDRVIQGFGEFVRGMRITDCRLVIIGDGECRDALETLAAELDLGDQIQFAGHLENPYPWLQISDLFITASMNEGISNAVLEAMLLNNVVITAQAGGIHEMIIHKKNGWLLENTEAGSIAEAIRLYYQNEDLRQLVSDRARQDVIDICSLKRMSDEMIRFYREILDRRGT